MMVFLLLIGCSPSIIIVERNVTVEKIVYNNTIEYINNTIIIPCNQTEPEIDSYDRSYMLSLIRRVKFLEGQQDKYFNDSECSWELNQSNTNREKAENELCEWNSSWC